MVVNDSMKVFNIVIFDSYSTLWYLIVIVLYVLVILLLMQVPIWMDLLYCSLRLYPFTPIVILSPFVSIVLTKFNLIGQAQPWVSINPHIHQMVPILHTKPPTILTLTPQYKYKQSLWQGLWNNPIEVIHCPWWEMLSSNTPKASAQ